MADRIALSPAGVSLIAVWCLSPRISIQPKLRIRLSINSPAGMGRRAAIFQSLRLRYCITARWAMFGNSAECLPVISCLLSWQAPARSIGTCSANTAERRPRPLLPDANALLNFGRQSPHADIASAGWKCLRARDAFPRTNSFDDDINSGQRVVDLALHVVDLGLQEFLHVVQFGNYSFIEFELNRATEELIRSELISS
jgi:hypothetical protein